MFAETASLTHNFSGLRLCVMATSPSPCNDALPPPPATRLDTTIKNNSQGPGAVPLLRFGSSRPQSPQDRLAIALSLGQPTKQESKVIPPVTKAANRNGSLMASRVVEVAVEARNQSTEQIRQNMQEELLKRLTKSNLAGNKQSPEMQAAFAKRLEELLFKTSKSMEAYADTKTLDRRLQSLMAAMQKRKAGRAQPSASKAAVQQQQQKSSPAAKRSLQEKRKREVLLQLLGQAKMTKVFKVIAEIKLIQLGREVKAGKPYAPLPVCTRRGCTMMVPCQGDETVPPAVRDLFFKTAIVPAYEKSTPEQLSKLPWDQLLAQGEVRLAAYHQWFQQTKEQEQMASQGASGV